MVQYFFVGIKDDIVYNEHKEGEKAKNKEDDVCCSEDLHCVSEKCLGCWMLRLVLKIDNGNVKAIGGFFFSSNKFQPGDTVAESTIYSAF